ncbi:MAG: 1-deoxy-D-xylulose-5-phosphate reductoisomerase [Desulfovibrionaceae bacterium]|nr:1-deoxy-D-xylulose-5-phosphate reductoisomerase [Desulfovibrionaceae bacterium]
MAVLWPGREGPGIRYLSAPPQMRWQRAKKRSLVILGATGSIGRNALDVVERNPQAFAVEGLACARSAGRLAEQAARFRPRFLAVLDRETGEKLAGLLPPGYDPEILTGPEGYSRLAGGTDAETVLSAQAGSAGLRGTLAAVLAGKVVCLANKESLVLAGDLVRHLCSVTGASILPVDSEHFALFDCLSGRGEDADTLVLTASGGPFRGRTLAELEDVTPAQALKHPNWNMGAKITIDSATLMNKALEFIEACQLYGVEPDHVEVLIHPQSIIHSLVIFKDGSQLAQLAVPDMRLPIGSCLMWPRVERPLVAPLSLARAGSLTFEEVDSSVFPSIELARKAMRVRGGMSVVLNAADETAVELFLAGRCGFADIGRSVARAMENHLCGLRASGSAAAEPFCLPDAMRGLAGDELEKACWERVDAIEELTARTAAFVKQNTACGGDRKC